MRKFIGIMSFLLMDVVFIPLCMMGEVLFAVLRLLTLGASSKVKDELNSDIKEAHDVFKEVFKAQIEYIIL